MKYLTTKVAVLGVFVFCLLFSAAGAPVQAAETIKIGVIASITGWAGMLAKGQKEAFGALQDDINAKGGVLGRQIEVIIEDDQSSPTKAVIAATKLIKDLKVCAIIGPTITDSGMAVIPVVEQEKVPFLVIGPVVSPFKKWVFLFGPGDVRAASSIISYGVKEMGAKKVAILYAAENYGQTGYKIIQGEMSKHPGASIVIAERAESKDTTFVPQLMKVKAANPDLLILYVAGAPASIIAKNYKQLGMTTPVLCPGAVPMPDFIALSGAIAEESKWLFYGFKTIVWDKLSPSDPFRKNLFDPFTKVLQAKYPGAVPNIFHVGPYDGLNVLVAAIKLAGKDDPAAIRDALEKVRFEGFLGPYAATATDHQASPIDAEIAMYLKGGQMYPHK